MWAMVGSGQDADRTHAQGPRRGILRRAEAGCTAHEIASIAGHKTLKEVERYTKAADQTRLAVSAMGRVERSQRDRS